MATSGSTAPDLVARGLSYLDQLGKNSILEPEIRSKAKAIYEDLSAIAGAQRLRLTVLGETSSGKSTFINRLLGIELLASDLEPTTSVATRLTFGAAFQVEVVRGGKATTLWPRLEAGRETLRSSLEKSKDRPFLDPTGLLIPSRRQDVADFIRQATTEQEGGKSVQSVTIHLPSPYLAAAIDIIDTPGFNPGLNEADQRRHFEVTRGAIESSHLALFIIDGRNPLKSTEQKFLEEFGPYLSHIFFVTNKMDLLDDEEAPDTEDYVRTELAKKFGMSQEEVMTYFVSSIPCANGGSSVFSKNLESLRSDVVAFMQKSREAIVLERAARTLATQAEWLQNRATELAQGHKDRLVELESLRIAQPDEMKQSVADSAQAAYSSAIVEGGDRFGATIDKCREQARASYASSISAITDRTKVETVTAESSVKSFQDYFSTPLQRDVVDHVVGALSKTLSVAHVSFSERYTSIKMTQPGLPPANQIRAIAEEIVGSGFSGTSIASSVVEARKQGDKARKTGAMSLQVVGRIVGGPLGGLAGAAIGYGLGTLFGPSMDELKQKAMAGFDQELDSAVRNVRSASERCFSGQSQRVQTLVKESIELQLRVYIDAVEKLIADTMAEKESVKMAAETLVSSADASRALAKDSVEVASDLRSALRRVRTFDLPDMNPVLDQEALQCISTDAIGSVAAGGTLVPSHVSNWLDQGFVTAGTALDKHRNSLNTANIFSLTISALKDGDSRIHEQTSNLLQDLSSLGLSPLDISILMPHVAKPVDTESAIALAGLPNANVRRLRDLIAESAGRKLTAVMIKEHLEHVESTFLWWGLPPHPESALVVSQLVQEIELRRKRMKMLFAAGIAMGIVAIAILLVVLGIKVFSSLPNTSRTIEIAPTTPPPPTASLIAPTMVSIPMSQDWFIKGGEISGGFVPSNAQAAWPEWMQSLVGGNLGVSPLELEKVDFYRIPDTFLVNALAVLDQKKVYSIRIVRQITAIVYTADTRSWNFARSQYLKHYLETNPLPVDDAQVCARILTQLVIGKEFNTARSAMRASQFPADGSVRDSYLQMVDLEEGGLAASQDMVSNPLLPPALRLLALRRLSKGKIGPELLNSFKASGWLGNVVFEMVNKGLVQISDPIVNEALEELTLSDSTEAWFLVQRNERNSDLLWLRAANALENGQQEAAMADAETLLARYPASFYSGHAIHLLHLLGKEAEHKQPRLKVPSDITLYNVNNFQVSTPNNPWPEPFAAMAALGRFDLIIASADLQSQPDIFLRAAAASGQIDLAGRFLSIEKKCTSDNLYLVYPVDLAPVITQLIREEGLAELVEPAFLLSVIKCESLFQPSASSGSDASGLMQLLKPTFSKLMGKQANINDPVTNIRAGLRYFKQIIKTASLEGLPKDVRYAYILAGYHAGEVRAKLWRSTIESRLGNGTNANDQLRRVESIPISRTRQYLSRVLGDFQIYSRLLNNQTPH